MAFFAYKLKLECFIFYEHYLKIGLVSWILFSFNRMGLFFSNLKDLRDFSFFPFDESVLVKMNSYGEKKYF